MSYLVMAAYGALPRTIATHQFVGNDPGITHYP